ncbi:hypothetical protein BACCAP_03106 [Pseudoflavonifractor capillosus ATCC 29799]|uniref:Uncharacterized protein n=1 Tax=Pseudoflavonifractor capillosus ATCC 29799 TaxID=411467 RepID=A6NY09_9FIRM|nr:hypothetical protein BACCAP_03106 [Pseudoflavonifractor capillosus ATCC 29799]
MPSWTVLLSSCCMSLRLAGRRKINAHDAGCSVPGPGARCTLLSS